MKGFKEWLNEVRKIDTKIDTGDISWRTSIVTLIFHGRPSDSTEVGSISVQGKNIQKGNWIPVFPSMLEKISRRINCFHVTSAINFPRLVMLQHSKRPISCATVLNHVLIHGGVRSGSGVVVRLSGNLLIGSHHDMLSVPDSSGHRWIEASSFASIPIVNKFKRSLSNLVSSKIEDLKKRLIKKYKLGNIDFFDIPFIVNKEMLNKIISDYIEGSKKIWEGIVKFIDTEPLNHQFIGDRYGRSFNEIIVNNIDILNVLIIRDPPKFPGNEVPEDFIESICKKNNIKYTYVYRRELVGEIIELMDES